MKGKSKLLFVAISLGLAWAIRGQFGHEWGASWAGAVGVLALLLVSGRKDWAQRAPALTALGAIGWGAGGMMSYGIVVGYCRSLSLPNAWYGFAMLAVIGGLYGFIGGGLFGLGLESEEEHKPNWPRLVVEIFTGGFLVWGIIIYQMEWFMTPPRSELWAACLGAALALSWFLSRGKFYRTLRVAGYSALGAGFGFAFGNFLQILGNTSGLAYNWWNVMEFTLGFFGGLGMAYGVLTQQWPKSVKASGTGNRIALVFVFMFIPLANLINGFNKGDLIQLASRLGLVDVLHFANSQIFITALSMVVFFLLIWFTWIKWGKLEDKSIRFAVPSLLFLTALEYNLFTAIKQGLFFRPFSFRYSDSLYPFIIGLLFLMWIFLFRKTDTPLRESNLRETWWRWGTIFVLLMLILFALALISVNIHGEFPGAHNRF